MRRTVTRDSFWYFFHVHLAHYVKCATAPFQRELFGLAEGAENLYAVAFRGSGKSTILTTAYPLWAIFGRQRKRFVLILCQTQAQAKQHMMNIRRELEGNPVLRGDFGPFREEGGGEWGSASLVFSAIGARITVASSEQSIRGLRHHQHRPDLIVCDDVEDMASAKTREGRQRTHGWLTGEVVPAGDPGTRLVVVGNLLHEDSLLMRIRRDVAEGRLAGQFREYPLLGADGRCLWPGKYPDAAAVEAERRRVGDEVAWRREYLLQIVPDEDQAVDPSWLVYYDELPAKKKPWKALIGVDLAISQRESADCTAAVVAYVYGHEAGFRVYVLPEPLNARLSFPATIEALRALSRAHRDAAERAEVLVEDVGYQRAVVEQLDQTGVDAEAVRVAGDKRARLLAITSYIKAGKIRFPRKGCERLIEQLVGFGVERHDDLVDALTIVGHRAIELDEPVPRISFICWDGSDAETIELGDTGDDY